MSALRILDVPEDTEWERAKHLPRATQPTDFSLEPCARCPAPCCASVVRLTSVEALRIAFTLAIEPEGFLEPWPVDDERPGLGNGWPLILDEGRHHLRLRHRGGGCIMAFAPADRRVRCGAHALRPGACRVYPHTVEHGEHRISVGSQKLCEVKWLQNDDTRVQMARDVERWLADLDADKEIIKRWNRGKRERTFANFCRWLKADVASELGYDPSRLEPLPERKLGRRLW